MGSAEERPKDEPAVEKTPGARGGEYPAHDFQRPPAAKSKIVDEPIDSDQAVYQGHREESEVQNAKYRRAHPKRDAPERERLGGDVPRVVDGNEVRKDEGNQEHAAHIESRPGSKPVVSLSHRRRSGALNSRPISETAITA